jgi:hypothetical protein
MQAKTPGCTFMQAKTPGCTFIRLLPMCTVLTAKSGPVQLKLRATSPLPIVLTDVILSFSV